MALNILQGNVLDAKAEAIILTIDGAAKGMEGNLSREFASRFPGVWNEIQNKIEYPVPLGSVIEYETAGKCAFRLVLLATTLNHLEMISDPARQGIICDVTEKSLNIAAKYKINAIASPVLTGGWRLTMQKAFLSIVDGFERARQNGITANLDIHIMNMNHYKNIKSLAQNIGWR
jgi:hypothetical protein